MHVVIIIPAYNESRSIAAVINRIPKSLPGVSRISTLVVDDGSEDETARVAQTAGAIVHSCDRNYGLSRAFQFGVQYCLEHDASIMVNIDADGQFDAADIPKLLTPLMAGKADCVTASRFIDPALVPDMPRLKRLGNAVVARLISRITGTTLSDVSCGFRAYSRQALLHLNLFSKYTYTHETLMNLLFKQLRVIEVPLRVRGEREFGRSKIAHNLWQYGYNIFNTIARTVLDYRPLKIFGWSGLILFGIGVVCDVFILGRLFFLGSVSPYKTIGFIGGGLNIFGVLLIITGLVADMINRVRMTQERILYYEKKRTFTRAEQKADHGDVN